MIQSKTILISTITASLFVLAGCSTQTATNTANVNTDSQMVANTNETVPNENANILDVNGEVDLSNGALAEVDTSDPALSEVEGWLTYTNEEYGFSFKYPIDAKLVENEKNLPYPGISFLSDITIDNTKQEDLQGVTIAFALTDLDLTTLTQKIEQSDTSRGITLAKVGSIQEGTLNQFTVYQGSHATAIGVPTDFYYVPLKSNFALFIFYNSDENNVNSGIISTLSVED